jgi:hypothetical protein
MLENFPLEESQVKSKADPAGVWGHWQHATQQKIYTIYAVLASSIPSANIGKLELTRTPYECNA